MKIERVALAAAAAALAASLPALAQTTTYEVRTVVPGERIYVEPGNGAPYHGGYMTEADASLLGGALSALDSDRAMDGSTVTMVANNGELVVNGTATDIAQASRMETKLRRLNGGTHVTAWFNTLGG